MLPNFVGFQLIPGAFCECLFRGIPDPVPTYYDPSNTVLTNNGGSGLITSVQPNAFHPTANPTGSPTATPTHLPTHSPSSSLTNPTVSPTNPPTRSPSSHPTANPTGSPTPMPAPTCAPIQFDSLFSSVGNGMCVNQFGNLFTTITTPSIIGGADGFKCGVWCSQNMLPNFVGFQLIPGAFCECLFRGIPDPVPTYYDPSNTVLTNNGGSGLITSVQPNALYQCFRYNEMEHVLMDVVAFFSEITHGGWSGSDTDCGDWCPQQVLPTFVGFMTEGFHSQCRCLFSGQLPNPLPTYYNPPVGSSHTYASIGSGPVASFNPNSVVVYKCYRYNSVTLDPVCTDSPSHSPSSHPTASPHSLTHSPSSSPTNKPTVSPTNLPSISPSSHPTANPTGSPTATPTHLPTHSPSSSPTNPTVSPTNPPTRSPSSHPTANPTGSPTPMPAPTRAPIQFDSLFSSVGNGMCVNQFGNLFTTITTPSIIGGADGFKCGVWCSQNMLPNFVGFQLIPGAFCECLFRGIPDPVPTYYDPSNTVLTNNGGSGLITSVQPNALYQCFRYNEMEHVLMDVVAFFSEITHGGWSGSDTDCGDWCPQQVLPTFVGFMTEGFHSQCRCLFSGQLPNPLPTYYNPPVGSSHTYASIGSGPVASFNPNSVVVYKCYRYNSVTLDPVCTDSPSHSPSSHPTASPHSLAHSPSSSPTNKPTVSPTNLPSISPSSHPTANPTGSPTATPTFANPFS
eukprot:CCRYP_018348-RA/>CCRYP_018348-RA protein AED:0.41 eAED:0.16 QI:0/0/0/0.5/1/1/6/0/732